MSLPTGTTKLRDMASTKIVTDDRAPTSADNSDKDLKVGDRWFMVDGDTAQEWVFLREADGTTITVAITSLSGSTLTVDAGEGLKLEVGDWLSLTDGGVTEVMKVTAIDTDEITVDRGYPRVSDAGIGGTESATVLYRKTARYATWAATTADTVFAAA
jgi:hypothetical protein